MPSSEWTVEDHLRDEPAPVVALYQRFVELVQACGVRVRGLQDGDRVKGSRRGFAGAKPRAHSLDGYLDLQRRVEDPRIRSARGLHQAPGGAPVPHQRARAAG